MHSVQCSGVENDESDGYIVNIILHFQLTDVKGTPVGVASVQYIPGSGHPVVLS